MKHIGRIGNIKVSYNGQLVDIGRRVRQYRKLWDDMTQVELAKKARLTASYISQIELNKITPSDQALERIAGAFGVSVPELLGA